MPTVRGGSGGGGSSLSNGFVIRFTDPSPLPKCMPLRPLVIPLTVTPAGANSIAIVNNNNTQVTHIGGGVYEIEKIGGIDGARDAAAVSTAGATGDFVLRIKPVGAPGAASGSFQYGAGVNSDPLTNDSFDTIDHLWFRVIPALLWSIFEAGADVGDFGDSPYAWIWRTGSSLSYGRGADLASAKASPDRTVTDSSTMYFDSVTFGLGDKMEVMFYNVVSVASLTAAFATFSYTGQAANLVRALPMAASLGTFSYTGQAAALTVAPRMAAGLGTFSYSGQAANLSRSYTLAAGLGAFTYSGQAAALSRGLPMAAAPGVFSYTGQVATLAVVAPVSYSLAAGLGVFSYTGQPATLTVAIAAPSPWTVEGDPPPVMWTVEGDPELADNVEEPYSATYFDPIYYQAEGNSWVAETGDGTTPVEVEADPLLTDDTEGGFNSLFYDPAFYDTSVLTWMLEDEPQRVAILEET